jgi:recombination protein RecA
MRKITNMIGRQKISLIFTNQLRQKMNAMFGDPWTTSGGKALAFHASVRLRLKNMGQIKMKQGGQDRTVGMKVRCQVVKNRMGPPLRAADFEIFFDRGIDNYGSWLKVMKENSLVKQAGAWYTYVDTETGEEIKFQSKDFIEMMGEREELREQIYKKICEETILQYKGDTLDIDNMEIDTKGPGINE